MSTNQLPLHKYTKYVDIHFVRQRFWFATYGVNQLLVYLTFSAALDIWDLYIFLVSNIGSYMGLLILLGFLINIHTFGKRVSECAREHSVISILMILDIIYRRSVTCLICLFVNTFKILFVRKHVQSFLMISRA